MLRSFLNSETTNTNGAIKPCQSPSQKPATPSCSLAIPLDGFGPGAHPARTHSTGRTTMTSKIKEGFIRQLLPQSGYEARAGKVSERRIHIRTPAYAHRRRSLSH